jgi:hypothetical protein
MYAEKESFQPEWVPFLPKNWKTDPSAGKVPILSIRIRPQAFSPSYALAPPPPPPPSPVSKLVQRHTERLRKIENLLTVEGGGGRGGAKS